MIRLKTCILSGSAVLLLAAGPAPGAEQSYPVTDFGAVAGGAVVNTAAIQRAIDTAAHAGGGTVVIPAGVFRSGSLFLRQGVALHLAFGMPLWTVVVNSVCIATMCWFCSMYSPSSVDARRSL